jgi:hypothetical protein
MAFFAVATAVRILPISTAIVLFYAYPLFAALFKVMIYKEKISFYQAGCMAVLIAGVAVLFDFRIMGSFDFPLKSHVVRNCSYCHIIIPILLFHAKNWKHAQQIQYNQNQRRIAPETVHHHIISSFF